MKTKKTKNDSVSDLEKAINSIKSQLGNEAIKIFSEKASNEKGISTGILGLDNLLGTKGIVKGRIYEIFGPESSGKTSLSLQIIQSYQNNNKNCAFIDVEHALDPGYAKKLGIDENKLIISQPDSGENAFEIIEALIKTNAIDLIVIDSVAALLPKSEIENSISDTTIGVQARLMSKGLRRISGILSKSKTSLIFINQIRNNINTFYGSNEITPGGKALKFYASVRIEIRRIENMYKSSKIIGNRVRIKIAKNKMFIPFQQKIFDFIFNIGIDKEKDFIEEAIKNAIIIQKGPYYYYDSKLIAQGKEELFSKIKQDSELKSKILSQNQ